MGVCVETEGDIEPFFGVIEEMHQAALKPARQGAQWTGITTRLGEALLASGEVTAVLCVGPDSDDKWRPVPRLITATEDMATCRGMRMGYAPLLELLEPAIAAGHKRLAVIGIPCQIYALRALEPELALEHLVVIGTPAPITPRQRIFTNSSRCSMMIPSRLTTSNLCRTFTWNSAMKPAQSDAYRSCNFLSPTCAMTFPLNLSYLCRLREYVVRHYCGLYGRTWRAVAARSKSARQGSAGAYPVRVVPDLADIIWKTVLGRQRLHREYAQSDRRLASAKDATVASAHCGENHAAHRPEGS